MSVMDLLAEELNDFFGTTPQELINYFGTIFFCEEYTEITWIDGPKPGYRMTTKYKKPKTSAIQENSCTQDNSSDSASISSVPPPQTDPPH